NHALLHCSSSPLLPSSNAARIDRSQNKKTCPELASGAGLIFHRYWSPCLLHLAKEARANNVALLANRGVRISHWPRRNRLNRGTSFSRGFRGVVLLFGLLATAVATAARRATRAT